MAPPRKLSVLFARVRQADALLYDWLRDHHDEFAAELEAVHVRSRWNRALKVIAERKLVDDRGNPATRDTAIRTWKRVREDVAAARARQQAIKAGQILTAGEVAPGVRAIPSPGSTGWDSTRPAQTPGGLFPGDHAPVIAVQPGSMPGAPPDGSGAASSGHLDRLRGQMEAGKVPTPKVV